MKIEKVNKGKKFEPFTITIENEAEANALWLALNTPIDFIRDSNANCATVRNVMCYADIERYSIKTYGVFDMVDDMYSLIDIYKGD